MPLYAYECRTCGEFKEWRHLSEAGDPTECPHCQVLADRTVSLPFVNRMSPALRTAHARNEKSAHEPMVMSKQQLDTSGRRRSGHSHGHFSDAATLRGAQRLDKGARVHVAPDRPWLVGH